MSELKDKVALVTGGASGIGKAVVELFLQEGARVVVSDINLNNTSEMLQRYGANLVFVESNAASASDNKDLVQQVLNHFGSLDIAVNNAGIAGHSAPVAEYELEDWDQVISVNLNGVFYGMRYQIPAMLQSGSGSIINIASILGQVGFANSAAYTAAKHGVVGLTKSAAWEYGTQGIRINAVGPGFIETPLLTHLDQQTLTFLKSQHALQRLGTSKEVAQMVLWLASEKASFATGGYYPIEGGYLAK